YMPVWVQNLGISLYGLSYRRERLGGHFARYVQEFRERDRWSGEQMSAYVDERLRAVLLHTFRKVPYYRDLWSSAGVTDADLAVMTSARLPQLAITPKTDLRKEP